MVEREVIVKNETGIHARPASLLVQTANEFEADIKLIKEDEEANAKSIMGVMSLAVSADNQIIIKAEGVEEEEAVEAIVELIESNFGEE
ncbi:MULTISPECIES: HPr family phosphocarrier protein [unclassified Candidatus Frackibacter]|uniref:HPr family phosphocarrier protein n=1 Tax=unclassified Candidatus Frackibacter TaxID=2648818 RepID=UPI00088A3E17|nr:MULTISPECIES: HPr family phosphocarrier protein [unclassified Candidatus Frackibacter]SDC29869.1 phosphocarrier protein [Candidatus Frackibacter sp. WG11]SEM94656.1 phosphocarrier protein [Candidatus Frackibacter sp. WG12]SFL57702.1 phosphocarrier protein [Candidatus Frackibacter sp. WG13]